MEVLHNHHSLIENYYHCHVHHISNQELLERPSLNLLDHDNVAMKMKKQNVRDLTVVEDNNAEVVDDNNVEVVDDNNAEVVVDNNEEEEVVDNNEEVVVDYLGGP